MPMDDVVVGAVLGERYLLEQNLAMTAISTVFKGKQLSTGQPVAIKLLNTANIPSNARARFERRFRREMAIYAEVRHPHLVRLLDTGTARDSLYIVLDFIDGQPMSQLLRHEGQLEPFEAKHIMGECLDALAAGHSRGIVHRDFKPGNVMITRTGARRHATVLDFGLAGLQRGVLMSGSLEDRPITAPGSSPGTPSYMAPEQLEGRFTPQSDIFAWGLVYVECMTGRRVVSDRLDIQSMAEIIRGPIRLPRWLSDHPLGAILQRATASALDARYQTAQDVLTDLRRCPMGALDADRSVPEYELEYDEEPEILEGVLSPIESVLTSDISIPSLVLEDLDAVSSETSGPLADVPPAIGMDELAELYEDYASICAAVGQRFEMTRERFIERASVAAEKIRRQYRCHAVKYRIVVDGSVAKLQPRPIA